MVTPIPPDPDELVAIAEKRDQLHQRGWRPLALLTGDKKPLGREWEKRARQDPPEVVRFPCVPHAMNTGVLADGLRLMDVDVDDPDLAQQVRELAQTKLGDTLIRHRSNSGRFMMPYRAADPQAKKRTTAGPFGRIEFLGVGQQALVHGKHPSGAALEWVPVPPWQMAVDDLPSVTEQQIDEFCEAVAPLLGEAPAKNGNGTVEHDTHIPAALLGVDVAGDFEAIAAGNGSHDAAVRLAGRWAALGLPSSDAVAALNNALLRRPDNERDPGWHKALADVPRLVKWAYEQEEAAQAKAAGGAPPSSPPPPSSGPAQGATPPPPQPQLPLVRRPKFPGNVENVMTLLRQLPELTGRFAFDLMARGVVIRQKLPWHGAHFVSNQLATDNDYTQLQGWLQRYAHLGRLGRETVFQAVDCVAAEDSFHPVRDWLHAIAWDNTQRLDTWLTAYAGVVNTDYTRAVGRMFLIGMIARIERPGCKFDYTLVLEGTQGILKSQLLKELGGPWFSDQLPDIRTGGKETSQHMRGKWLLELAELESMSRSDVLAVNAFLTRTVEIYRPPWGRKEVIEPRQCAFAGTTNKDTYLRDPSGGRRFWGVLAGEKGKIDPGRLRKDRDQLFAEALRAFQQNEHWWPEPKFEETHMKPQQDQRLIGDVWDEPVEDWLAKVTTTTAAQIAQGALGLDSLIRLTPRDQQRIFVILRRLGWVRRHTNTSRYWEKPP